VRWHACISQSRALTTLRHCIELQTESLCHKMYVTAVLYGAGAAVSIAGRPKPPIIEQLPGPADYQSLGKAGRDAPAFTLYGRYAWQRCAVACHCMCDIPGMLVRMSHATWLSATCLFLCCNRIESKPVNKDLPAPGEYDLPPAWRTGPAVTITGRHEVKASATAASITATSTCLLSSSPTQEHLTWVCPLQAPRDTLPGPGEYDTSVLQPRDGPAFTIAGRIDPLHKPDPESPGPGEYFRYQQCM
jgi:hypothetical protein